MYLRCFWHFQCLFKKIKNSKIYFRRIHFKILIHFSNRVDVDVVFFFKKYLNKMTKSEKRKRKMRDQSDFGLLSYQVCLEPSNWIKKK